MNEKQAKLIRYFVKATGQAELGAHIKRGWPYTTPKAKGKVTTWMKKMIVTMLELKKVRNPAPSQTAEIDRITQSLAALGVK